MFFFKQIGCFCFVVDCWGILLDSSPYPQRQCQSSLPGEQNMKKTFCVSKNKVLKCKQYSHDFLKQRQTSPLRPQTSKHSPPKHGGLIFAPATR